MVKISSLVDTKYEHLDLSEGRECPVNHKDYVPATLEDTDLILVGEAPGEREVEVGEGFVGRSGSLLRDTLHRVGITEYSLTNIVKCRPEENKKPTGSMLSCCMSQTADEVRGYPVVALFGNTAIQQFFPGQNARNLRGNACVHPDFPGQRFYCFYHPAYCARKGDGGKRLLEQGLARLKRVLDEEGPQINIVRAGSDQYEEALQEALDAQKIAFDIETNKLESWHPDFRITSLALTHDGENVVFCHEEDGPFVYTMDEVAQFLATKGKQVIGHNVGFDIEAMEQRTDIVAHCQPLDTMDLWYHANDERMPSLKYLTAIHLDGYRNLVPDPTLEVPTEKMALYNSEDVIYPWRLFHQGIKELDQKQLSLYMHIASRATLFTRRISANGILFDRDRWLEVKDEVEEEIQRVAQEWLESDEDASLVVRTDFDPETDKSILKGTNALKKYAFERKGLEVVKETDKGNPSVDKDALQTWINNGVEELDYLLEIRGLEKLKSTYIGGGPHDGHEAHVDLDGRVHSSYRTAWTDSGRLSSKEPNLQNPARDKRIRSLYTVHPGRTFFKTDLSQIELRIMLCLAGDEAAMEAYERGVDGHLQTAMEVTGKDDPNEITKEERTLAKPINFGLCVPMDTEILTKKEGWKSYEDVKVGDQTLGFQNGRMVWTKVTGKVKYEDRPIIETSHTHWSVRTTPAHRWYGEKIVDHGTKGRGFEEQFFRTQQINSSYKIWRSRPLLETEGIRDISPDEVALIGWLYTDGQVKWAPDTRKTASSGGRLRGINAWVFQHEDKYANEVRQLLQRIGISYTEKTREDGLRRFCIPADFARDLLRRANLERGSLSWFVRNLSHTQLERFVRPIKRAEGSEYDDLKSVSQNEGKVQEAIELALFMEGYYVSRSINDTRGNEINYKIHAGNPDVTGQRLQNREVGQEDVWCVQTEAGTWTMRQDGQVMVTGNCYRGNKYTVRNQAKDYGYDWDLDECKEFVDAFFRRFPELRQYHKEIIRELRAGKGWVQDATGHRHYYEQWNDPDEDKREYAERSAINAMGQGPASYITEHIGILAQQEFRERGLHPQIMLVNTVHDELDWSVQDDYISEMIEVTQAAVSQTKKWIEDWFEPPLVMEYEGGDNWADMEELDIIAEA